MIEQIRTHWRHRPRPFQRLPALLLQIGAMGTLVFVLTAPGSLWWTIWWRVPLAYMAGHAFSIVAGRAQNFERLSKLVGQIEDLAKAPEE